MYYIVHYLVSLPTTGIITTDITTTEFPTTEEIAIIGNVYESFLFFNLSIIITETLKNQRT